MRRISGSVCRLPLLTVLTLCAASATALASDSPTAPAAGPKTMADVLAASKPSDWRALDPENTLYMELASGRVVIELAPRFAPNHVATIRALAREHYYDGLVIERVQDDYVAQWGDPDDRRSTGSVPRSLAAEFARPSDGLEFVSLSDPDTYAPETGFVDGFPAARDPASHLAWLTHCYAMVGAGRDNDANSGGGRELYAVIGHAPRSLDRNVTLLGRVVQGIELLSSLPRGSGALGFYEHASDRVPIRSIRIASDVPDSQRSRLEVLRTDTQTFTDLIESRRNRHEEWFKVQAGRIDICNIPLPVRSATAAR
jgi:cyclophilin family peptidyl-prolyl cis-trans isomerase